MLSEFRVLLELPHDGLERAYRVQAESLSSAVRKTLRHVRKDERSLNVKATTIATRSWPPWRKDVRPEDEPNDAAA